MFKMSMKNNDVTVLLVNLFEGNHVMYGYRSKHVASSILIIQKTMVIFIQRRGCLR